MFFYPNLELETQITANLGQGLRMMLPGPVAATAISSAAALALDRGTVFLAVVRAVTGRCSGT
jgi:hypothetical protein